VKTNKISAGKGREKVHVVFRHCKCAKVARGWRPKSREKKGVGEEAVDQAALGTGRVPGKGCSGVKTVETRASPGCRIIKEKERNTKKSKPKPGVDNEIAKKENRIPVFCRGGAGEVLDFWGKKEITVRIGRRKRQLELVKKPYRERSRTDDLEADLT